MGKTHTCLNHNNKLFKQEHHADFTMPQNYSFKVGSRQSSVLLKSSSSSLILSDRQNVMLREPNPSLKSGFHHHNLLAALYMPEGIKFARSSRTSDSFMCTFRSNLSQQLDFLM